MRDIKFRGKRIDNGEWIYGYYNYCTLGGYSYIAVNNDYDEDRCYDSFNKEAIFYKVIPETVGEFTGLKDKNGKEIYEEDILSHYDDYLCCIRKEPVLWSKGHCAYVVGVQCNNFLYYILRKDNVEVIGNIYDKPELLEGVVNA